MKKGITLIETVVAVTVLIFALGGPFLMAAKSLKASGYAREEVAAARLAEEGLEIVHNMRDNNAAESDAGRTWDTGFANPKCATGCIIDIVKQQGNVLNDSIWKTGGGNDAAILDCVGVCDGEEHRVYKNTTTGLFRQFRLAEYGGNPDPGYVKTNMTRIIRIIPQGGLNNREYKVESIVSYYAGPNLRTITLTDTILNWFPSMNTLL
jgi:type II secretory pathway pseudopilin PulG